MTMAAEMRRDVRASTATFTGRRPIPPTPKKTFAQWQATGQDKNIVADLLFESPKGDFRLKQGLPLLRWF